MFGSQILSFTAENHYWYTSGKAEPVAKLEMKPLAVAVSYDANISQLKPGSRGQGGFEVALTYQAYKKSLTSSQEAVRCPKF